MDHPIVSAVVSRGRLLIVCVDGSVWRYRAKRNMWEELPALPGSDREKKAFPERRKHYQQREQQRHHVRRQLRRRLA